MFKPKLPQQEQGFTLVEVLISILIATMFVAVAMQMMAVAAIFKARAQDFAEATTWIQEDLENVKYQAANYHYTSLTADSVNLASTPPSSSINVASIDGFAVNNNLKVGSLSSTYTITAISGNTLTITPQLSSTQLQGALVVATARCNSPTPTADAGFADGLRDWITDTNHLDGITDINNNENSVDIPLTSNFFTNKTFRLRRTTTISSDSPYNVLRVSYDVSPTSSLGGAVSGLSVANFYTEVIPNAALQCP